jgi:hypothetical protein
MRGDIPPVPNTPSWGGAQSTGTTLPLPSTHHKPIMGEWLVKYKIINKYQLEVAQVNIPNPK